MPLPNSTPPVVRRYYPKLSSVVSLDDFPESLGFIKQAIQQLFDKIHYKDLQYNKSPSGDAAFYSLSIVSDKLAIDLFGSGVKFVLNPDGSEDPDFNISTFPITVEYQWKILGYLRRFNLQNFSFTPQEFFELGLIVLNITEEQAVAKFINTFTVPINDLTSPLQQFLDDLNEYNNDHGIQTIGIDLNENSQLEQVVREIHSQTSKNATLLSFAAYLLKEDLDVTKQKLAEYFKSFIPTDIEEYIKDILVPKARVTLTVSSAIEFSRTILYPYKDDGNGVWVREDENSEILTRFYFGKVLLYADTQAGLGYQMDLVGNLAPTYSEIGKTGLLIQLEKMKLDLSDKTNIPEADADGRPLDFRGVYVDALSVTLPSKWFKTPENDNGATLRLGGYNLLIGTGGLSGTFALEAIPTRSASDNQIIDFFSTAFSFIYPITGIKVVTASSEEQMVTINNYNELLDYLNELENKNLYRFKFPLKLTPAGQTTIEIPNQQVFRDYITNMVLSENGTLWFGIGKSNGFLVGFNKFDITFKQNKVISSNIKGALEIKKFVYPEGAVDSEGVSIAGQQVRVNIDGHLSDDGDFNLTASAQPPFPIVLKDVFTYNIKSLELGKEGEDFYIGTSGTLQFEGFLKNTMGLGPVEIERLRIYSDGSIELVGGSINLIKPIVLKLGPVEITVSAIHYGSHQKEVNGDMRKFNYFGFDGGISVDPLGVEIRGDGVKFYYCVDDLPNKPKSYLHIQTLYLDLTIPSSSPAAIINGWLSIPEPGVSKEYAGGIKIQLPKAKIAGKADMKLMPKYPAFIIDAEIEFPAPIPLGTFAIYGFRGLLGYRYVAEKEAANLVSGVDTWYDYYKAPPRGIHVTKFNGPDKTKASTKPFSIGAGASLGTSFDNGTVLNIKAMVLLSIPSLFMIDGRAAIISARLGLEDTGDPPFFAFVAMGDDSLEFGFGADFKLPTSSGFILKLYADIQAGFFFKNQRPWYVNIGTKTNPITAEILTLIHLKSFVMLSAKGIEAGSRGDFAFNRTYGIIRVSAWAYIEVGGKVSFERPQFGAYLQAGVGADIDIKFISLYLAVDIMFGVESPKPFLIYGKFYYKVRIRILWVFKFSFSGNLEVFWDINKTVDRSTVDPLINQTNLSNNERIKLIEGIVKGVNMLSNETFELAYLGANIPASLTDGIKNKIIPLDTYIDIKTEKGLLPGGITNKIGGYTNPAERYTDLVPPDKIVKGRELRQVKHQYSIESISIKSWDDSTNPGSWKEYHPYKALYPDDPTDPAYNQMLNNLKIGQFQKTDGQYNTVRLLATTPFSFTEQGQPGWYIPEQYGLTASTLFCAGELLEHQCANFLTKPLNRKYFCSNPNHQMYSNGVAFLLLDFNFSDYAHISDIENSFGFSKSLAFDDYNRMQIMLPAPSVQVGLKVSNFNAGVKVKYYSTIVNDLTDLSFNVTYGHPDPNALNPNQPFEVIVELAELNERIEYDHPEWNAVTRVIIEPLFDSSISQQVSLLTEQIEAITHNNNLINLELIDGEIVDTETLEEELHSLLCNSGGLQTVGFINRYTKEDSFNYNYSREFKEGQHSFIYSVGKTQEKALISKLRPDGTIAWEKIYTIPSEKEPIEVKSIIQLKTESAEFFQYVAYITSGLNHYLLSIDSKSGDEVWLRIVDWKSDVAKLLIEESKINSDFTVIVSEGKRVVDHVNSIVLKFNNQGNILKSGQFDDEFKQLSINSTTSSSEGNVLAGNYLFNGEQRGVSIKMNYNLSILNSFCVTDIPTLFYDSKEAYNSSYFVTGYDIKNKSVFVSNVTGDGETKFLGFSKTEEHYAQLQLNATGCYVLIYNDKNGVIYNLDYNLQVIWCKEIYFKEATNGIKSFRYNELTQKITLNTFDKITESLVVYTDKELRTCKTMSLDYAVFEKNFIIKKIDLKINEINFPLKTDRSSFINLNSQVIEICKKESSGCGDPDERICTVYEQIKLIYLSYFVNQPSNDFSYYFPFAEDILLLLKNQTELMQLVKIKTYHDIISDFANIHPTQVNQSDYDIVYQAIEDLLEFLDELGNCNCACDPKKFTLIHEVCWMTLEDYEYNLNIPSQEAIALDTQATIDGITKFIQPVWRPNTNYVVHFVLKDTVDNNQSTVPFSYVYGFTTAGPVGFFHNHEKATYGDLLLPNGNILEDANGIIRNPSGAIVPQDPDNPITPYPDKYPLTSLKQYIDYNRSYPNADGNLLSAKPLFYNDETTQIYMFFNKSYATNFFTNWEVYNGKQALDGRLKIVIKDPVEDISIENPPYLDYDEDDEVHVNIPQTVQEWNSDDNPQVPFVLSQYSNLLNAQNCVINAEIIVPASEYLLVTPKHLKPNKLYTAIVNNLFKVHENGVPEFNRYQTKEVHRFVFKTSRYENFKYQINSYYLNSIYNGNQVEKESKFDLEGSFSSEQINAVYATIKNQPIVGFEIGVLDNLENNYQHSFDKVIEGILGFKPVNEAISTEINVIRNTLDNTIIALLVKNPEPFNNPRMPLNEVYDTIQVISNGTVNGDYEVLFSKDYSQAIIMNEQKSINENIELRFKYKIWNGTSYVVPNEPDPQEPKYTISLAITLF
jgi:hypothetical protein